MGYSMWLGTTGEVLFPVSLVYAIVQLERNEISNYDDYIILIVDKDMLTL
jgi:RNAse (barnase) inhibitor barstar